LAIKAKSLFAEKLPTVAFYMMVFNGFSSMPYGQANQNNNSAPDILLIILF
jgi:hypothetical protein